MRPVKRWLRQAVFTVKQTPRTTLYRRVAASSAPHAVLHPMVYNGRYFSIVSFVDNP